MIPLLINTFILFAYYGTVIASIITVMTHTRKEAKMNNLKSKLAEAREYENNNWERNHKNCYVIWSEPMQCYLTQLTMPLLGEWYTSDGIQHGMRIKR